MGLPLSPLMATQGDFDGDAPKVKAWTYRNVSLAPASRG